MPRKRSVSGRAKARTIQNAIQVQINRLNKRQRSLKKRGNLGKYKSKELLNYVSQTRGVKLVKAKRSGVLRIALDKTKQTYQQYMGIRKKFAEILKSRAFSNVGIDTIRKETEKELRKTLKENHGGDYVTRDDIDTFYEIAKEISKAKEDSLLSRVNPSAADKLVNLANKENWSADKFAKEISAIANIDDINSMKNITLRREALRLYNKYVA